MTNDIVLYKFNEAPIRTQIINDNPYFCLVDVCDALGLSNSRKSKTQLNENGVTKSYALTNGGKQEVTFINEPNLYRLIFRSNKPQAQAFANWVYEEVLPAIRQTGNYSLSKTTNLDEIMKTIGGVVKKCTTKAIREYFCDTVNQEDKADFAVDDMQLLQTLYRWSAYKAKDQTLELRNLRSKLELITNEFKKLQSRNDEIKKLVNQGDF